MRYRLLGPLEVREDDKAVRITGPRERTLLAVLLLRRGEVVSADRLVDLLWGDDPPANARNALQAVVTRLRRAMGRTGRDNLLTRAPGYTLIVEHDEVDVVRFEDLVARARRMLQRDPAGAGRLLDQALALWRGPALQDLADLDLAQQEIARLDELRLAAREDRIEAYLAVRRHPEAISELRTLIAEQPLRERPRGQLMTALYRSGQQADALDAYQEIRTVLREELGLDPGSALQTLHQRILRQDPTLSAPIQTIHPRGPNLPARISSFVGRESELLDLRQLVAHRRLVTVIGPGGSGKTSLAIEVARAVIDSTDESRTDGVFFVDLATTADPAHVPAAVAAALGLRGGPGSSEGVPIPLEAQVEDFVRTNEPLLLLDNCEHVIEAVARLVDRLLRAAPGARVLATSREPLGLAGEVAWSIPGLATPDPSRPAEQLGRFGAVQLFQERAAACRPGFALDAQTAPVVAEICRRLDGLPLAIELAAARTRTLPVEEIVSRLDDRFRLLTTADRTAVRRQQTLRAALDWSYDLLTAPERLFFVRLSVFAGSWTLDAAIAVCSDDQIPADHVLDLVARLVDRSLVQPLPGPTARFRMLETIREYARTRLEESGEADHLLRSHAIHFLRVAESAGSRPESVHSVRALEDAADDTRTAIRWALTAGAHDVLLRFAGALGWYWATWHDQEGVEWMSVILDAVQPEDSATYGRALLASAFVESYAPSPATKQRALRSVELLESFDDRSGTGRARLILSFIQLMLGGDVAFAEGQVEAADIEFTEIGDAWGRALASLSRFRLHLHAGRLESAIEAGRDALTRFRALGDPWGIPWTTMWLGTVTRMAGDIHKASRLFEEAIASSEELAYVRCAAHAELGVLAAFEDTHEKARAHQEAAVELAAITGVRDSLATAANADGLIHRFRGDPAAARTRHLQALAVFEDLRSQIGLAHTRCCLGYAELHAGEADAAAHHLGEAVDLAHQIGRSDILAAALEGLACVAVQYDASTTALLLGAARSIRDDTGISLSMIEGRDPEEARTRAETVLGSKRYAAVTDAGRRLCLDRTVLHALKASAVPPA